MNSQAFFLQEQVKVMGKNQYFVAIARTNGLNIGGLLYDFHYFLPYWAAFIPKNFWQKNPTL